MNLLALASVALTWATISVATATQSVLVVMGDGHIQVFSEQEALARVREPAFAQALGHTLPLPPITPRDIWKNRSCGTTHDRDIERDELKGILR